MVLKAIRIDLVGPQFVGPIHDEALPSVPGA